MTGVQHKIVGTGFGIAAATVAVVGMGEPMGALVVGTSIIGSMLPDIDHDKTKIGRKRKVLTTVGTSLANIIIFGGIILGLVAALLIFKGFVDFGVSITNIAIVVGGLIFVAIAKTLIGRSKTWQWATRHRGMMHTLVVPALLFVALRASDAPIYKWSMLGLLVGYISHLFADMETVEGCPILFPLTKRNIRFPTKFKTKDKSCTVAAYVTAILAVGVGFFIANMIK